MYFIHTDHLNTPRLIADASGTTVWRWDQQEPFGVNAPDENPSGLGAFEFPIRFPGQYAEKETGLHQNGFRDFDPSLGRFEEFDPIGLRAGINGYQYVKGSPLRFTDPAGLYVCGEDNNWKRYLIPDFYIAPGGIINFTKCCQNHDGCYDFKCFRTKAECDDDFLACAVGQCRGSMGPTMSLCLVLAAGYYTAITQSPDSDRAFSNARKKCINCPANQ
jgi:RHS repeat-associated protein